MDLEGIHRKPAQLKPRNCFQALQTIVPGSLSRIPGTKKDRVAILDQLWYLGNL